jgi:hypothetical protein
MRSATGMLGLRNYLQPNIALEPSARGLDA